MHVYIYMYVYICMYMYMYMYTYMYMYMYMPPSFFFNTSVGRRNSSKVPTYRPAQRSIPAIILSVRKLPAEAPLPSPPLPHTRSCMIYCHHLMRKVGCSTPQPPQLDH